MNETILSVLELVRDSLPPALIGNEGYARLAAVADGLPLALTTFWGFECRLGSSDRTADILFQTSRESPGHRLLAGHSPTALDGLCRDGTVWQALRSFARLWGEPDQPFHRNIRNVWLEFDTGADASAAEAGDLIRQPSVFFGPQPSVDTGEVSLQVIEEALAVLRGGQAPTGLRPFIKAASTSAQIFQVGLMLGRPSRAVRLCVDGLSSERIPVWLRGLSWPGDAEALGDLLRRLAPMQDDLAVDLDVTDDGPAERIGLECYVDPNAAGQDPWRRLLSFIEELGLCLPRKSRALLSFPGMSRSPLSRRLSEDGIMYIDVTRRIHHVKLSFVGNRAVEAKGYLAIHRPGLDVRGMFGRTAETEPQGPAEPWRIG